MKCFSAESSPCGRRTVFEERTNRNSPDGGLRRSLEHSGDLHQAPALEWLCGGQSPQPDRRDHHRRLYGIQTLSLRIQQQSLLWRAFWPVHLRCFALANKLTTAANAIVLQFTAPAFILIYSGLFFRQKIRRADLAVVLIVLGGIPLVRLDQLGPSTIAGNFVAIAAGMFMAGMYMTVGNVELHERFSAIVIGQAVAFLVGLPAVITTGPVMTPVTVGTILALGVLQLGISYLLYVLASRTCPALACCLLGAVEPLLNPVWVLIFNGERPGVFALAGGIIVIIAITVWCVWDGKQKEVQLCADT